MEKRRQLNEELEKRLREVRSLRQEFEEQNKARLQFMANRSHEWIAPLTPILACAHLVIEQFRPEPGSPPYSGNIDACPV